MRDISATPTFADHYGSILQIGYLTQPLSTYKGNLEPLLTADKLETIITDIDRFITAYPAEQLSKTNVSYWLIHSIYCAMSQHDEITVGRLCNLFLSLINKDPTCLQASLTAGKYQGQSVSAVLTHFLTLASTYLYEEDVPQRVEENANIIDYISMVLNQFVKTSEQVDLIATHLPEISHCITRTTQISHNQWANLCLTNLVADIYSAIKLSRNSDLLRKIYNNSQLNADLDTALEQATRTGDTGTVSLLKQILTEIKPEKSLVRDLIAVGKYRAEKASPPEPPRSEDSEQAKRLI